MTKLRHALQLVKGSRSETERLFRQLRAMPEQFEEDTFDELIDRFRRRMTIDERILLIVRRLEATPCNSQIEKRAVLAAALGDTVELARLSALLDRRNAVELQIVSGPRNRPK